MSNIRFAKQTIAVFVVLLFLGFNTLYAQTADEIIQKHITAIGGIDNWKKINTIKLSGSSNAQGMEIAISITKQHTKGMKMEITLSGMTGYMIITDKTGWNYMPFGGQTKPEVIPDDMIKQMQDALDVQGLLIDYQAKGNKVAYLGKDDVEGTECYKLKVTSANGKESTMYIDASNYYHIRTISKINANGKEQEQTSNFSSFQKVAEGIVLPMSVDQGMGPLNIKSVEINKPIPSNFFAPSEVDTKK